MLFFLLIIAKKLDKRLLSFSTIVLGVYGCDNVDLYHPLMTREVPLHINAEEKGMSQQTFKRLYSKYYKAMLVHAFRFIANQETAKDIVQEVFSNIWERKTVFESEAVAHIYIYNGVRNLALNILNHQKVEKSFVKQITDKNPEYDMNGSDEELLMIEHLYDRIFKTLDQLPVKQRQVIFMMLEGKKVGDIAEVLQVSVTTVKTHRQRALLSLRDRLTNKEFLLFLHFFI